MRTTIDVPRPRAAAPAPAQPAAAASTDPGWGEAAEMSAFETVMWRAESDRSLRSPLLAVEELDRAPDWQRLLGRHELLVQRAPRLRQRVVEAPLDLGTPRWSPDPSFDLGSHLWRTRLPAGAGWTELLRAVAGMAATAFDRSRSPWEAVLVEGLPDGHAAYVLKIHHCMSDGLGAAQLLENSTPTARTSASPVRRCPTAS